MYIKAERFDEIVFRLIDEDRVSCDEAYLVAYDYLKSYVYDSWQAKITPKPSIDDLDDVMQEICIVIAMITKKKFLLPTNEDGSLKYPRAVGVYCEWMHTVGRNYFLNYFKKLYDIVPTDLDDNVPDTENGFDADEEIEKMSGLVTALGDLLESRTSVYLKLTFLAFNLCVVNEDIGIIEANHYLEEKFCKMTLYQMFEHITLASQSIIWLRLTDEQFDGIMEELDRMFDRNTCYGDMRYEEFFYDNLEGHLSISKWLSRVIARINGKK